MQKWSEILSETNRKTEQKARFILVCNTNRQKQPSTRTAHCVRCHFMFLLAMLSYIQVIFQMKWMVNPVKDGRPLMTRDLDWQDLSFLLLRACVFQGLRYIRTTLPFTLLLPLLVLVVVVTDGSRPICRIETFNTPRAWVIECGVAAWIRTTFGFHNLCLNYCFLAEYC